MIRIFKYFLQSILIYLIFFLIKIFGLKISRIVFAHIFQKIGPMIKSKKIIEKNLEIFKNDRKFIKDDIIKLMWSNYGKTFIEYMFLKKFSKTSDHIKIKGEEILNDIISQKKQVIFVSGHFANFELMSMELTKRNVKLATIYRPLNNFFLNPLMEYLRKKYICRNQVQKGIKGLKETINYIKNGFNIALMIDQRLSEGIKSKFFGKDALTTTLPAQLINRFNLEIVPIYICRLNNNNFEMEIMKPISFKESLNTKEQITDRLNVLIEDLILREPSQWIWTHNRWK